MDKENNALPKNTVIFVKKNKVYCKLPDCQDGRLRDALETYPEPKYDYVFLFPKEWKNYELK